MFCFDVYLRTTNVIQTKAFLSTQDGFGVVESKM